MDTRSKKCDSPRSLFIVSIVDEEIERKPTQLIPAEILEQRSLQFKFKPVSAGNCGRDDLRLFGKVVMYSVIL